MGSELASVVDQLVDQSRPPSHDELDRVFDRAGVRAGDPPDRPGKMKRVRAVASWCLRHDQIAGGRLVIELIGAVRAEGGFAPDSPAFVGESAATNLRRALDAAGFMLDDDGKVLPQLLDSVPEVERHSVLSTYAARLRRGASDSPLVTGAGKDLLEAPARHVLVANGGTYNEKMGLPGTLLGAYTTLGLTPPPGPLVHGQGLDQDPRAQLQQAVFLLGVAVNRLRNAEGTGHGRPFASTVTDREAELASQAIALASELLLRPR